MHKASGNIQNAVSTLSDGYKRANMTIAEKADMLQEMAALATRLPGKHGLDSLILKNVNCSSSHWKCLLREVYQKDVFLCCVVDEGTFVFFLVSWGHVCFFLTKCHGGMCFSFFYHREPCVFLSCVIGGLVLLNDIAASAKPELWGRVLRFLQHRPEPPWHTLRMLFLGDDSDPAVIQQADCHQMAPVHGIFHQSTPRDLGSWVPKLLIILLHQGLPCSHLVNGQHTTPLHVAMESGIKAGGLVSSSGLFGA